jgi:endonuclease YncB( thermonuclease family)
MLTLALAIAACQPPPAERVTCVVDGDTVWIEREKIRLIDIDAPEMEGRCAAERALARRSRDRLIVLLRRGPVRIERDGTDKYGRTLARLDHISDARNMVSVGEVLVSEGLARRWGDRRGWCG